jgi:hypothetical protein
MDKGKLDEILEKHKAQPVGVGYIDIIVKRDNYEPFICDLIQNGYQIECISWWEWCSGEKRNNYGLGGPKSRYFDGWFSELSSDVDDVELTNKLKEDQIREVLHAIETKSISFPAETVSFKQNDWLTPAIWLDVPDDWRNEYCA